MGETKILSSRSLAFDLGAKLFGIENGCRNVED